MPGVWAVAGAVLLGVEGVLFDRSGKVPVIGPFSSILVALGGGAVGREGPKSLWDACLSIPGLISRALGPTLPFVVVGTRGLPVEGFKGTIKGN